MSRRIVLFALTLSLLTGPAAPARACVCGPTERILEFQHEAFEGRLVEIRLARDWHTGRLEPDAMHSMSVRHPERRLTEVRYAIWTVEVEATYGTELPARVELINEWSSCRAPARPIGERLFVMARRDGEGRLHVDTCVPILELEHGAWLGSVLATWNDDTPLRAALESLSPKRDDTPLQRLWEERRRAAGLDPE